MAVPQRRHLFFAAAAVVALQLVGALLFAWSGLYNIAASRGHFRFVAAFLEFGMRNSVETHSLAVTVPETLASDDQARLGAAHYESICVRCHGAPGRTPSATLGSMLPHAPDLSTAVRQWNDAELFWIVKHGLKYTGMPAWPYQSRDDEVWAVVAFLRRMPRLDAAGYAALALGNAREPSPATREAEPVLVAGGGSAWRPFACARCHGDDERPPVSSLVPRLAGQSADYLARALEQFADGRRQSGIMSEIAAQLAPAEITALARYYAGLARDDALAALAPAGPGASDAGGRLALGGATAGAVPPCVTCHGATAPPQWPRLAGQSRAYIAGQLRLWKAGHRRGTPDARLMGMIAERMSEAQIDSVAAYYGTLPRSASAGESRP